MMHPALVTCRIWEPCAVGPAEQSAEEVWQKLQEHPDVLAAAPDDEVLAELLAVQVS